MTPVQIVQAVAAMVSIAKALYELHEDTSAEVLERLRLLENSLIERIGLAINALIRALEQEFDTLKLENAMADTKTAMNLLYTHHDLGLEGALAEADGYSSSAAALMLQQDEVFFVGGLIAAGNVRIDVIRTLDPGFASDEYRIQEITDLAEGLERMLSKIEQRIPGLHSVQETSRTNTSDRVKPPVLLDATYMSYLSDGVQPPANYPFRCTGPMCSQLCPHIYTRQQATQLANAARNIGLREHRKSVALPEMQEVLATWRGLIARQQISNVVWAMLGYAPTPFHFKRASREYFAVEKRLVPQTASAERTRKDNPFLQPQIDARPFLVDLLTSTDFSKTVLAKVQHERTYDELLTRIFDRLPEDGEKAVLGEIEEALGLEGLIAGLIYGKEYAREFGTGVPISRKAKEQRMRTRKTP